jgi:hypothetical protein
MTEPCRCEQPNAACRRSGEPMVGRLWELCRGVNCPLSVSEAYRQAWDNAPQSVPTATPRVRCRWFGALVGEQECDTCAGRVRLKVFHCTVRYRCTPHKALPDMACCADCSDYLPPE